MQGLLMGRAAHPLLSIFADLVLSRHSQYPHGDVAAKHWQTSATQRTHALRSDLTLL